MRGLGVNGDEDLGEMRPRRGPGRVSGRVSGQGELGVGLGEVRVWARKMGALGEKGSESGRGGEELGREWRRGYCLLKDTVSKILSSLQMCLVDVGQWISK